MKQVLLRQGTAVIEEVPAPIVDAGSLLVAVKNSCISIGTELGSMTLSGGPLWKRALKQPENVAKVLQMVATSGVSKTKSVVQGRLAAGAPTGYSAAGRVISVGNGINHIQSGDRVACAGAQYANHAEIIRVPINLCVPVPELVSDEEASTVTLGAIALQGVRRLQPTLGETFVVIGLGLLGQITGQILRANGCRVIGVDLDPRRIELAKSLSIHIGISSDEVDNTDSVFRLTDGIGADGVIVTAATPSSELISKAFKMCRKKARVVLVGDVGLDIKRSDIYAKELDFLISCSYGPGRYDSNYEELGLDYPVGYVRWTENRNMAEYLNMIAEKKIQLSSLIESIFPVDEATQAYELIQSASPKPLSVLLAYPGSVQTENKNWVINPQAKKSINSKIRIALIGAGGFAKGMHLPNMEKLNKLYHLQLIVSQNGANAMATAKQFQANAATTDYNLALNNPEIDAVLITTRHDQHASMALKALQAGKHVLVEKPLCLSQDELNQFQEFYQDFSGRTPPILLVGFNRRFSPHITKIFELIKNRSNPMIINYRMNAGYIALDHWVHNTQGGGRNIGEACHIYDLFTYLTQSRVVSINAQSIDPRTAYYLKNDNFTVNVKFADGSLATLIYTALGNKEYPKEQMEIFVDGKVIQMNDYKSLNGYGIKLDATKYKYSEKGQLEELNAFAQAIQQGGEWPVPFWQIVQATEMSLNIENQIVRTTCAVL